MFLIFTYIMLTILILQVSLYFSSVMNLPENWEPRYIGFLVPKFIVTSQVVYKGVCSLILIIGAFFWLLMNILLYTQINNFLMNQTMNERYGARSKKPVEYSNSERSFIDSDAQAALLRNASIDSTLEPSKRGK
jgi:hypothetical protein